ICAFEASLDRLCSCVSSKTLIPLSTLPIEEAVMKVISGVRRVKGRSKAPRNPERRVEVIPVGSGQRLGSVSLQTIFLRSSKIFCSRERRPCQVAKVQPANNPVATPTNVPLSNHCAGQK